MRCEKIYTFGMYCFNCNQKVDAETKEREKTTPDEPKAQ